MQTEIILTRLLGYADYKKWNGGPYFKGIAAEATLLTEISHKEDVIPANSKVSILCMPGGRFEVSHNDLSIEIPTTSYLFPNSFYLSRDFLRDKLIDRLEESLHELSMSGILAARMVRKLRVVIVNYGNLFGRVVWTIDPHYSSDIYIPSATGMECKKSMPQDFMITVDTDNLSAGHLADRIIEYYDNASLIRSSDGMYVKSKGGDNE